MNLLTAIQMKVITLIVLMFLVSACGGGSDTNVNIKTRVSDSEDTVGPLLVSLETNVEESTITFTFNESLDTFEPLLSDFQITQDGELLDPSFMTINDISLIITINDLSDGSLQVTYEPSMNPIRDLAGNESSGFIQMVVSDGYIRGAEVYADSNNNGIADESELIEDVTTDALGQVLISGTHSASQIIIKGGVNVDTGAVNLLELTAPLGYSVINPLSTLVQKIVALDDSQAIDQAEEMVMQALGIILTGGEDLSNYDPISDVSENVIVNRGATTQIATILAVAALVDVEDDSGVSNIEGSVLNNLAKLVKTTSEPIKPDANMVVGILSDDQNIKYLVDVDAAITAVVDLELIKENAGSVIVEDALAEVIKAQAKAIDKKSPVIPKLELSVDSDTGISDSDGLTNDTNPSVKISFDTESFDGKAVIAGDIIELVDDDVPIVIYELKQSDIDLGFYTTNLTDLTDGSEITATINDLAGNKSGRSSSAIIDTSGPIITSAKNSSISALDNNSVIYKATVDNSFDEIGDVSFSLEDTTLYTIPGKSSISTPELLPLTQHVYVSSSVKSDDFTQETVVVSYNAFQAETTGLGLRVHFDSSTLLAPVTSNILNNDLIASGIIVSDDANLDSDASTDKYLNFAWASFFGSWPGSISADLATITFEIAQGAKGTSPINFTVSSSASGLAFDGQNHLVATTGESAPTGSKLTINSLTGDVILAGILDPTIESEYSFTITATDLAGNENSQPVTLTVTNQ